MPLISAVISDGAFGLVVLGDLAVVTLVVTVPVEDFCVSVSFIRAATVYSLFGFKFAKTTVPVVSPAGRDSQFLPSMLYSCCLSAGSTVMVVSVAVRIGAVSGFSCSFFGVVTDASLESEGFFPSSAFVSSTPAKRV